MEKFEKQSMASLISPASLQQKIRILNKFMGIKYVFYDTSFSTLNIKKDKLLIKLTKSICNIPNNSLHILAQLPRETFSIEAFSLLPRYGTRCITPLIQTINDSDSLGHIHQGIIKSIRNKCGGVEHLPQLKYKTCSRSPTTKSLYILKKFQYPSKFYRRHRFFSTTHCYR